MFKIVSVSFSAYTEQQGYCVTLQEPGQAGEIRVGLTQLIDDPFWRTVLQPEQWCWLRQLYEMERLN